MQGRIGINQSILLCLCSFLLVISSSAYAGFIGNIKIDNYSAYQTGTTVNDQSGVTITAHYTVTDPNGLANCCDAADLRWLQLVDSNKSTGFTPNPNRPFIDPKQGQNIGGGVADGLPWYDPTYPTSALAGINYGVGPYIFDMPAVNNSRADDAPANISYKFVADTILACIFDDTVNPIQLVMLGGFEWGFTISNDGGTPATYSAEKLTLDSLNDTVTLRNTFNTALALDFPGYQLIDCTGTTCEDVAFRVPEPASFFLMVLGLIIISFFKRSGFVLSCRYAR